MYDQKLAFWRVLFMVPINKLTKLLESNFMQGYKFAFFSSNDSRAQKFNRSTTLRTRHITFRFLTGLTGSKHAKKFQR